MPSIQYEKQDCIPTRFSFTQINFWLFRRDNSPVFEIAPAIFNKSNLPGENLSRIQTVNLATEYLLLQTLASAKYFIV